MAEETKTGLHKWVMIIDPNKCVLCHACTIACQNQNSLASEEFFNRLEEREQGSFPNYIRRSIPVQCQHCDNPPCVDVCPVGASYKRKDGVVMVNFDKCIGCKYCILACPYGVRQVNREKGYIHKCTFCIEFVEQGQKPACQTTCPMGVRTFGDLNDPADPVHAILASKKTVKLLAELKTLPSIYYIVG
jgi:Fe-S-cluster-containing dehydrogenase component